jgi:hypothetical protein
LQLLEEFLIILQGSLYDQLILVQNLEVFVSNEWKNDQRKIDSVGRFLIRCPDMAGRLQ